MTWANQVRILKQQFEQLSSIVGQTFINALKPVVSALNVVIAKLIEFAQAVSDSLGKIFGWKYEINSKGVTTAADTAEELADSTGSAADSAKELKKQLAGIDELNNLSSNDSSSGSGSGSSSLTDSGASSKDLGQWVETEKMYESGLDTLYKLGDAIGTKLTEALAGIDWDSIYQTAENFGSGLAEFLNGLISPELFYQLGRTIANSINTALHFLDGFGTTFDWTNFGKSLGAGLNGFMLNLDWALALKNAKTYGEGIANTINSALETTDFTMVGSTVANALNTAIQFAFSLGDTLDFGLIGDSIADSVNGFFKTFNFAKLAKTLNTWAKGLKKALIKAVSKIKWSEVFDGITEFFGNLDFDTILVSLPIVIKLFKQLASSTFIKNFKNLAEAIKLSTTALAGNQTAATALATQFPNLSKVVNVARQAFANFQFGIENGNFMTGLNEGITAVRNNLTTMQKGLIGVTAVFAEFSVLKESFYDIALGSDNLVASITKIAGVAAAAASALYVAFGPAGLAVAGITAAVSAISGINKAFDEIRAEEIGQEIKNAMTTPGGTSISDIAAQFSENVSAIGDSFSIITEKSAGLSEADSNIQSTWKEIEKIETSMDAGVLSVEAGTTRLTELFGQLQTAAQEKFGLLEDTLLAAFGEDGVLTDVYNRLGISTENTTTTIIRLHDKVEQKIEELIEKMNSVEYESDEYYEYKAQLAGLLTETDDLTNAMSKYSAALSQVDYSKLFNEDGSLNEDELNSFLTELSTAVTNAKTEVSDGIEGIREALNEDLQLALNADDMEGVEEIQEKLDALPDALELLNTDIEKQALAITDTMQTDFIDATGQIIDDSIAEWNDKGMTEQWYSSIFGAGSEDEYVQEAVDQQKANIDTVSAAVEEAFSDFETDGTGWASDAMDSIYDALFEQEYTGDVYTDIANKKMQLNDSYKEIIEGATEGISELAGERAKDAVDGYAQSLDDNSDIGEAAAETFTQKVLDKIAEVQDSHSPSKETEKLGKNAVLGYNNGITNNTQSTLNAVGTYTSNVVSKFSTLTSSLTSVGQQAMEGLKNGLASKESDLYSKAESIANNIASKIKSALDIHSPSRVMFTLGDYTMQGFSLGMESQFSSILDSVKNFNSNIESVTSSSYDDLYGKVQQNYSSLPSEYTSEKFLQNSYTNDNAETNYLLRELISAVNNGNTIEIDGKKVFEVVKKYNNQAGATGRPTLTF